MGLQENSEAIMRRLAILKTNYPKLTIFWSPSPKTSVQFFQRLKKGSAHLDVRRAEKAGKAAGMADSEAANNKQMAALLEAPEEAMDMEEDLYGNKYNPMEFLTGVEGVTQDNLQVILTKVKNVYELAMMPLQKLQTIVGMKNGEVMHNFLHRQVQHELDQPQFLISQFNISFRFI
eukprot:TRINITY_DN23866_c0_g1_i1.p4 TRINITY_DN23866_c0_g1~~TRINITY_DN23866_c0_g1_i1.p4  ORF type:complete len:176 (-),score=25.65 TRINITY_DN23866_c0_g1_i1:87-614(-)